MILPLIGLTVVLLIVLVIVGVRVAPNEGGEDVIRNVYVYLVLFATLMMIIGGSVSAFMALADIIFPTHYYQTFEDYRRVTIERPNTEIEFEDLTEEELRERYNDMVETEKERRVNRAYNSLIKSFGWIAIPLPIFVFFQRRLVNRTA